MEKITPVKVVELLGKNGIQVSIEQATIILEFLRKLADIAVLNYLKTDSDENR